MDENRPECGSPSPASAFVNSFGEFGEPAPGIAAAIREHKDRVRAFSRGLVPDETTADQLFSLVDGATVRARPAKVLLAAQG